MSPNRKILIFVLTLVLILWAGFIFSNSLLESTASHELSAKFITLIDSSLLENQDTAMKTHNFFRKAAHFFEFFLLSILFYLVLSGSKFPGSKAFLFSAAAAFLDEGLQILSNRNNSLRDVALDSCGAAAGILLVTAVLFLIRRIKVCKEKKKSS